MATPTTGRDDNVALAVTVIVATVLALSFGDALIKGASADLTLWQIFTLRSLMALPLLLALWRSRPRRRAVWPVAPGWTALRSLMLVAMWIAYYAALPKLQLSIAAAAYYTAPIFITLFSGLLAGERVGLAGWIAVALGFGGVALILRPSAEGFSLYALLPLASATLYALAMILTRTKCRGEDPVTLSIALNIAFLMVGLGATAALRGVELGAEAGFLAARWGALGWAEIAVLACLTGAILAGSLGAAVAYQAAPASIVATFDFAYVGFAALWGLAFFGETPDAAALLGMALIVVAGVIVVRRPAPLSRP